MWILETCLLGRLLPSANDNGHDTIHLPLPGARDGIAKSNPGHVVCACSCRQFVLFICYSRTVRSRVHVTLVMQCKAVFTAVN